MMLRVGEGGKGYIRDTFSSADTVFLTAQPEAELSLQRKGMEHQERRKKGRREAKAKRGRRQKGDEGKRGAKAKEERRQKRSEGKRGTEAKEA